MSGVLLLLVGCSGLPAATEGASGGEAGAGGAAAAKPYSGSVSTRAVARTAGSDSDVDVFSYVQLNIGGADAFAPGGLLGSGSLDGAAHGWSGRFAGRLYGDLDGDEGDLFDGLEDTRDGSVQGRVYDAWADYRPADGALEHVRIGRQSDFETPVFLVYDGLRAATEPLGEARAVLGVYGGASTHQYESSNDGDRILGAWAEGRPWSDGRVRLDWIHAEDERALGSFDDELLGLSIQQRFPPEFRTSAAWTSIGGESRDLDLDATWADPKGQSLVRVSYYELFETQSFNPLEFDTYSQTLFDWFPFRRAGVLGWTRVSKNWRLEGGLDVRDVDDEDDEGRFNRDVRRAHVTASWENALGSATTLNVTGDDWQSDARDVRTVGLSVDYRVSEATDVSVGTYYAAYEFDELLLTEREDVRTWYARVGRDLSKALGLDAAYSFQDTEFEEFHTLKVTLRWLF